MRLPNAILSGALAIGARLVPKAMRAEWAREWRAELWHLEHGARAVRDRQRAALSLSYGIVADAAWLRMDWVQSWSRGSAYTCLWIMAGYSLLCVAVERVAEGSWRGFAGAVAAHFLGGFVFVAAPAVFAAVITYPLRPLRCYGADASARWKLSARTRWNLFLAAKLSLTLLLGFLGTAVATEPARLVAGVRWAWVADWVELLLSALVVTVSLRWALLDQEQRCQKCLRCLRQPTRVGPPSRNFLEWSGMAMACEDGHGRLHVPEMDGSWCWYDRWVELDSGLTGLLGG